MPVERATPLTCYLPPLPIGPTQPPQPAAPGTLSFSCPSTVCWPHSGGGCDSIFCLVLHWFPGVCEKLCWTCSLKKVVFTWVVPGRSLGVKVGLSKINLLICSLTHSFFFLNQQASRESLSSSLSGDVSEVSLSSQQGALGAPVTPQPSGSPAAMAPQVPATPSKVGVRARLRLVNPAHRVNSCYISSMSLLNQGEPAVSSKVEFFYFMCAGMSFPKNYWKHLLEELLSVLLDLIVEMPGSIFWEKSSKYPPFTL